MQQGLFPEFSGVVVGTSPQGFSYGADFLSPTEQLVLLRQLQGLHYEHDTFRGQRLKRGYAQFGYAYVSSGRLLTPAAPMPDFLLALVEKGKLYCIEGSEFNQCIVTHYPERAGIGWHTDASRFGESIMAISLGAEARLEFRPNGSEAVSCEVLAAPGSLYVMHGSARWHYQHQVVAVKAARYSLTFRQVTEQESRPTEVTSLPG